VAMAATEIPDDLRTPTGPELDDLPLGIVGAGKLGTSLARAAIAAGFDVAISGSGPADDIALTVEVLAAGARAATTDEVVRHADIIVLAVPTHRFRELPRDLFAGKILIDAMNYWEPVDGDDPELTAAANGTSMIVQESFPSARVVKASTNSATTNSKRTGAQGSSRPHRDRSSRRPPRSPPSHAAPRSARVRPRRRRAIEARRGPRTGRVTDCRHLHRRPALEPRLTLTLGRVAATHVIHLGQLLVHPNGTIAR